MSKSNAQPIRLDGSHGARLWVEARHVEQMFSDECQYTLRVYSDALQVNVCTVNSLISYVLSPHSSSTSIRPDAQFKP